MDNTKRWYEQSGAEGDVVISTRVRLARNLSGTPFPAGLTPERKREVSERVRGALKSCESGGDYDYLEMGNMTARDALAMVERHLISPEFAQCSEGSALLLKKDESVSR